MVKKTVIAVIPAYNCEKTIGPVVRLSEKSGAKIIVVDDGSTDRTGAVAARAGAKVIRLARNRGKAAALAEGVVAARRLDPDFTVFLDADGQHNPREIPLLLEPLRENLADICIGTRLAKGRHPKMPRHRHRVNKFSSGLTSFLTGLKITDLSSGYRAFNRKALRTLSFKGRRYDIELATILEAAAKGLRVAEVPVETIYGDERSHIHPVKLIIGTGRLWLKWLLLPHRFRE
jgi:glycosyltransferase involved in cell wall biosynthesis